MTALVVGGGIVGLCSAHYLAEAGYDVTVIAEELPGNTSIGNAGMIVPSHYEPLANPSMLRLGMTMWRRAGSPLGLSDWNPSLLAWMARYTVSSTSAHVNRCAPVLLELGRRSRQAHIDLFGDSVTRTGLAMVAKTPAGVRALRHEAASARKRGVSVSDLDGDELAGRGFDAKGGILYEEDAFVTPTDILGALAPSAKRVTAVVKGLQLDSGRIRAVCTREGDMAGDLVVLAAGYRSANLAASAGCKIPLISGRGYGFTVPDIEPTKNAAILIEPRIATTPMAGGQRFTGVMELGAEGTEPVPERLAAMRQAIPRYVPATRPAPLPKEVWVGHRPCTPDGMPIIGRPDGVSNLIIATGHGMLGLSLGPITGRLVAQIAMGAQPEVDLELCSPDRW